MLWYVGLMVVMVDIFKRVSVPLDHGNPSEKIIINTSRKPLVHNTTPVITIFPEEELSTEIVKNDGQAMFLDDSGLALLLARLKLAPDEEEEESKLRRRQAPESNAKDKLQAGIISPQETEYTTKTIFEEKLHHGYRHQSTTSLPVKHGYGKISKPEGHTGNSRITIHPGGLHVKIKKHGGHHHISTEHPVEHQSKIIKDGGHQDTSSKSPVDHQSKINKHEGNHPSPLSSAAEDMYHGKEDMPDMPNLESE